MFKFIHARTVSDIADPWDTLGIEITDKTIASECKRGNLDGQHGPGLFDLGGWEWGTECPIEPEGRAAIDIASDPGLDGYSALRPGTLATSRPDLDSIGAMAVIVLRSLGLDGLIDRDFVRTVAERDSFVQGPWAPSPLPTEESPWPRTASTIDASPETAAFGMICSPRPFDSTRSLSLAQRVYLVACRLISSRNECARLADAIGVDVLVDGRDPAMYIGAAHTEAWESRRSLVRVASTPGALEVREGVAIVRVAHAGALALGYCLAPVVVAFDQSSTRWFVEEFRGELGWLPPLGASPNADAMYRAPCATEEEAERLATNFAHEQMSMGAPGPKTRTVSRATKVTVAAYGSQYLDVSGLKARLSALETGWGGGATIIGSPHNGGTKLAEETIVAEVARFVR